MYGGKAKSKKRADEGRKFLKKDQSDANMLVAIRIRPMNAKEKLNKNIDIVGVEDKLLIVMDKVDMEFESEGKKPDMLHRSKEQKYFFDRIFNNASQEEVFQNTCSHLIGSVSIGYNACVFAYGTTGSGKTHTMLGNDDNVGISVLTIQSMFTHIQNDTERKYDIKVSYVEIYNEFIRDLLVVNKKDTFLDLRDDPIKGVMIAGVTEFQVVDTKQVLKLLLAGNRRRTTEATNANETSSRSHAILQIQVSSKEKTAATEEEILCGKLSLIDLAGSERGTATENKGLRLREGAKINTSLLALANCINALGDKQKKGSFVPYRDSKLTRLLKDSLGGNCKTVMIATISPASAQYEETVNTLKYANRAKNIKMRVQANKKMVYLHISAYKNIIADLKDEIETLKTQIKQDFSAGAPVIVKQSNEIEDILNEEVKIEEDDSCSCTKRKEDETDKS